MSKFEYPRFSRNEIIELLAESQIAALSETDFLHPDPDKICNLYGHIILRIDTFQEDHGQIEFGALEQLENPDNHSHSVRVMNLYNKIRQLVAALKCPIAFTLKDLIKPETDRTERFVSALLNFHVYREAKLGMLRPHLDVLDLLEGRKEDAEKRIEELNAEIAEFEESRESEMPLVQEVSSKVKELRHTVSELNNHQMNLKKEAKKLKEEAKEMDEKISNAEFALVQTVQENGSLRSKIVQSPDKLQRALEEKKLVQTETKKSERAAFQSFQDKTATLEAYDKACKKLSKHFAQMRALQEQVNSAKTVDKDVKELKRKLSDDGVLIKSLEAKLLDLQSKADQVNEMKKQLEKERALSREEVDKELKNVNLEVGLKKKALQLRERQVELMVAEGDAAVSKRKTVTMEAEAKMQEMKRKCEEIVAEFEKYSKSISNAIGETS